MRVFVTGATGFIGMAVVRELIDAGHQVIGLVRSEEASKRLRSLGAEPHRGSIEDLESLRSGAAAADGVIHTAFFHKFSHARLSTRLRILFSGTPRQAPLRFMIAAVEADRRAIETLGNALSGRDRALVVAMPTLTLAPHRLGTEDSAGDPDSAGGLRVPSEKATLALADRGVRSSIVRIPPLVHGDGDKHGFVPSLISIARKKGISAYIGTGSNRWPAVHRLDVAHLFRLALEKAPARSRFHAVEDEGMPFRDIAASIGQKLSLPVESIDTERAGSHFGWLGAFASADNPVSSALTQERLGWRPVHPSLIEDMNQGYYFR
jgi:nucleoside-diphosphate-sugar epimerase